MLVLLLFEFFWNFLTFSKPKGLQDFPIPAPLLARLHCTARSRLLGLCYLPTTHYVRIIVFAQNLWGLFRRGCLRHVILFLALFWLKRVKLGFGQNLRFLIIQEAKMPHYLWTKFRNSGISAPLKTTVCFLICEVIFWKKLLHSVICN